MPNIRKATASDIDRITEIYNAIHTEEEAGRTTTGWVRYVYPTRKVAEEGVSEGDMFVMEDFGAIVASARINNRQVKEYADCKWQTDAPAEKVMVLHTLTVDPKLSGRGYATAFVDFYEKYAMEHGCPYLRMDTQEKNIAARRLYKKLGYSEPAIVLSDFNGIKGVRLVCLEKKL